MQWFNCKVDDRSKVVGGANELKPLMDMFSHTPLNLDWIICTLSGFLLMRTFSNTLMFSSHDLTFRMLLFWMMLLHLHFLMKSIKKLMIHCFRILLLMNLETINNKWYSTWMCSGIQAQQRLRSILFMHSFMKAIPLNKTEITKALLWLTI